MSQRNDPIVFGVSRNVVPRTLLHVISDDVAPRAAVEAQDAQQHQAGILIDTEVMS
jgi:hypothetical protein